MAGVYFFNDTSGGHAGSKAVMRSLFGELDGVDVIATHRVGKFEYDAKAFERASAVVMNGEGSIHSDSPRANYLLTVLRDAQAAGKKTALINAVYQQELPAFSDVLSRLDLFAVRELRSATRARAHGGHPLMLLDSAADRQRLGSGKAIGTVSGIAKGSTHPKAVTHGVLDDLDVPEVRLRGNTLDDVVATLRQVDVYVTGQHHGIYAAGLAGIPFVAVASNSHKIEGLIEWSGLPIPVVMTKAELRPALDLARDNRKLFEEFAAFLERHDVIRRTQIAPVLGA